MLNWLHRIGRSKRRKKQGTTPPAEDRMVGASGPQTHQRFDAGPVPFEKQKPVLVRGRLWKNTAEVRREFSREQEALCDSSVEGLIKGLARVDRAEIRRSAAEGLGQLGQAAVPAIPALINSAVDVNATVREAALSALNAIDPAWPKNPAARKAFPDLVAALKSWSSDVTKAAFKLLRFIGPPAVPDLADAVMPLVGRTVHPQEIFSLIRANGIQPHGYVVRAPLFTADQVDKVARALARPGTAPPATPALATTTPEESD